MSKTANLLKMRGKLAALKDGEKRKILEDCLFSAFDEMFERLMAMDAGEESNERDPRAVLLESWEIAGHPRDAVSGRPYSKKPHIVRALCKMYGLNPTTAQSYVYGKSGYNPITPLLDAGLVSVDGNTVFLDGLIEETKEPEPKTEKKEAKEEKKVIKINPCDPMWEGAIDILDGIPDAWLDNFKESKTLDRVVHLLYLWAKNKKVVPEMSEYFKSIGFTFKFEEYAESIGVVKK